MFAVIEASDVDTLLEQFEASSSSRQVQHEQQWPKGDPKKKAQIMAAVNSHFSNSSKFPPGKKPKIGKVHTGIYSIVG